MDEVTRQILAGDFSSCDRVAADCNEFLRTRPPKEPAPAPPTNTGECLAALADEAAFAVADLEKRAGAQLRKLSARLERLERLEEVSLLRAENEELRKKADQLERRIVFVDLSKTQHPAKRERRDAILDFAEARKVVRKGRINVA
jgi:hypothetical protein